MKKWLLGVATLVLAIGATTGVVLALTAGGGGPTQDREQRSQDTLWEGPSEDAAGTYPRCMEDAPDCHEGVGPADEKPPSTSAMCVEGAEDCQDTIDVGPGDDAPVSSLPMCVENEPDCSDMIVRDPADEEPVDEPGSDTPDSDGDLVPAPIDNVQINIAESYPPQYFLHVVSGLPNGCVKFHSYDMERSGDTIRVRVLNVEPIDKDVVCTMIYGMVEHNIPLGSDFESGKTYTVVVNETTTTFVAQ